MGSALQKEKAGNAVRMIAGSLPEEI